MAFDMFGLFSSREQKAERSILSTYVPCSIGIEGLPAEAAEMLQGGLYAVTLPSSQATTPLAIDTLTNGLQQGSRLVLCSPHAQSLVAPMSALARDHEQDSSAIALMQIDSLVLSQPSRNIWDFLESLEAQKAQSADCIIYLDAGGLLATEVRSSNLRQLGILREWHRHHRCTGVFIMAEETHIWPVLVRHSKELDGLAHQSLARIQYRSRGCTLRHGLSPRWQAIYTWPAPAARKQSAWRRRCASSTQLLEPCTLWSKYSG